LLCQPVRVLCHVGVAARITAALARADISMTARLRIMPQRVGRRRLPWLLKGTTLCSPAFL
jgi:hypothetical protein